MFTSVLVSSAILVSACTLLGLVWLWLQGRRARSLLRHLPGLPTLPLIGNAHQILGDGKHFFKFVHKISKIIEDANLPLAIWLGSTPFIVVSSPEDVKAVTNAFVDKPFFYQFPRVYVGNGLITAPGDIWKRSIKKLGGTFTGSIVEGYQDVFNAQAQRLVQKLRGEVGKEPFDVLNKYLAQTSLENICQTALGIPNVSDSIVSSEYHSAFTRVFELLTLRFRNPLMHFDFLHSFTANYKESMKCVAVLHDTSDKIIASRRKERVEKRTMSANPKHDLENGKTKFRSFLDILFDLQDDDPTLTEEQIRSEVSTIIVGGQETTATTMFMTLLMLGCKPRVQEKLYAEMKEIFGDTKRVVEKEDLAKMKYCEAVLCETMRMYPPAMVIGRLADHDLQLKDCLVSRGTFCAINVYGSGRSKRIWGPDADEYRPERWLSEDCPASVPGNFIAFSYGRRSCIGKRYAMPMMKTVMAYCAREFQFKSEAEKLQLRIDVFLKAHSGHLMTINLRD